MTHHCFATRSAAMYLTLILCQLALVAASPFHKYPYVFLLDVGNEELEKTNTEQIRLSVPGGSLALRYPAVGTGDTISHIRVSGIDFGTDLKANIVDGGPGYKYVVLVFMGNKGVPYDAVMTVQTVSDEDIDGNQSKDVSSGYNENKLVDDNNDSAEITNDSSESIIRTDSEENVSSEDTSDELDAQNVRNTNEQITQQSSNVYNYADKSASYEENDESNEKDIHNQYTVSNFDSQVNSDADDDENGQDESNEVEPSHFNDDYGNEDSAQFDKENEPPQNVNNRNEKYQPVMPLRIYDGVRIYPQYAVPFALPGSGSVYNGGDAIETDPDDSDNDSRSDSDKYRDSNNNYFDSDDASAIAS